MAGTPEQNASNGLPGLRGADHIGLTVPDIEQARDFFVNVLGFEELYTHGPYGEGDDEWIAKMLNVDRRAILAKVTHLRCAQGPNIELFDYRAPEQSNDMPRNSDAGGHHIALYVDDIEAAVDHLKAHGVRIMNDGRAGDIVEEGPEKGVRSVYFLTPWDLQMELISYPNGKSFVDADGRRPWDPTKPAD